MHPKMFNQRPRFFLNTLFMMSLTSLLVFISVFLWNPPNVYAQDDIARHPACPLCGMDRQKFAHSRTLITYDDGSEFGGCSLHCAAIDMAVHLDKIPVAIQVGDLKNKTLIRGETAYWVIGGGKSGVMTRRAKWAFQEKADADAFIGQHGGTLATFEDAFKAAYTDMYEDTRMIREKRKMKRIKKEADAALKIMVPPMPGPEVKCPVCGMFVAKYPQWVGVVSFNDSNADYFDGAKDLFKYLFNIEKFKPGKNRKDISAIHVTEYYDGKLTDAQKAIFVIDSDVYGPMGKELIPFVNKADAETFMRDHKGKQMLLFDEVTPEIIKTLD